MLLTIASLVLSLLAGFFIGRHIYKAGFADGFNHLVNKIQEEHELFNKNIAEAGLPQSCVVCGASLMTATDPPHCEDCILD